MLDNFGTSGEQITGNRNVVFLKNDEISWVDRITNEEVSQRAGMEQKIMKTIRKKQIEFLGHITRKEGIEELMLTGPVNGKQSRGRQGWTYYESLSKWMTEQVDERGKSEVARLKILRTAKDRELWKSMVANVLREKKQQCYMMLSYILTEESFSYIELVK